MTMLKRFLACKFLAACILSVAAPSYAQETTGVSTGVPSATCPSARLFSEKLITDICWSCIFPIRIMGLEIGGGEAPPKASNKFVCQCSDGLLPKIGMGVGYWEPARLVELVRQPGCSPTLNGITLPGSSRRNQASPGSDRAPLESGMYHYHYYAFPILLMLDLLAAASCVSDGMQDFDIMYLSEIDPTWNSAELAFFTNPEAAIVANLPAQSACMIDAAGTAAGINSDEFFWCAGSWGSLYPLAGPSLGAGMVQNTSLLAARAIAALHRRGLALRTMGSDAMCRPKVEPMLPKTQYKMSMFYPVPEAQSNHIIGETKWKWGTNRMIPVVGEDPVYLIWRWNDCCQLF